VGDQRADRHAIPVDSNLVQARDAADVDQRGRLGEAQLHHR
jgi:hypothetical protein